MQTWTLSLVGGTLNSSNVLENDGTNPGPFYMNKGLTAGGSPTTSTFAANATLQEANGSVFLINPARPTASIST